MSARVFLGTNVWLYACSVAPNDQVKQSIAKKLIVESDFALSAQVLEEFVANALKKKSLGIFEHQIDATLELAAHVTVQPITHELVLSAAILCRRHHLSHKDSGHATGRKIRRCDQRVVFFSPRLA